VGSRRDDRPQDELGRDPALLHSLPFSRLFVPPFVRLSFAFLPPLFSFLSPLSYACRHVLPLVAGSKTILCAGASGKVDKFQYMMSHTNARNDPDQFVPNQVEQCTHWGNSATENELGWAVAEISEKVEDVPPDGGYGWVCTACNFFINAHTWGINSVSKSGQH
jgi:hypothetical protein